MGQSLGEEIQALTQILEERKIEIRECLDRIRWGYRPPGHFNVKEVAKLASGSFYLPSKKKWYSLWGEGHWLKINLLLYLLMRGRILT